MIKQSISLSILFMFLFACAQMPKFDRTGIEKVLMPSQVRAELASHQGKIVLWGGTILDGKNLKDQTRLEILAYPLDEDGWPDRDQKPLGRFLAIHQGYLETADYGPGRLVSVVGTISGVEKGKVGETRYTYPIIQVKQQHLWPKSGRKSDTRVHFGVGVVFH